MADDIDDLLDEVESKFCNSKTKQQAGKKSREARKPSFPKGSSNSSASCIDSDISDAVRDILDEDGLDLEPCKVNRKASTTSNNAGIKCFPILLSGTSRLSKDKTQRVCDRLHCTTCDNKVVTFENFEWSNSCDYLFFRNNYPDFSKLKGKLISRGGSRSYCCQCSWTAVQSMTNLGDHASFKWICKRH